MRAERWGRGEDLEAGSNSESHSRRVESDLTLCVLSFTNKETEARLLAQDCLASWWSPEPSFFSKTLVWDRGLGWRVSCGAYTPSGSREVRVGRRPRLAGRSYSLRREPAVKLCPAALTTLIPAQGRKPCRERKPLRWDSTCTQLCLRRSGAAARVCCSSLIRTHIHIHCMRWRPRGGKLFSLPRCRTPVSL